jgi:hypothetical protein
MPNYPGPANSTTTNTTPPLPQAIYVGDQQTVFNAEQLAVPQASIAVALGPGPGEVGPKTVSVEGFFSGAPGVYEIDLQTSDTDADAMYAQEGTGITTVSANNTFRAEFTGVSANFARLLLKSRANAVNLTARIRTQ